jgi:hypothetical protein
MLPYRIRSIKISSMGGGGFTGEGGVPGGVSAGEEGAERNGAAAEGGGLSDLHKSSGVAKCCRAVRRLP